VEPAKCPCPLRNVQTPSWPPARKKSTMARNLAAHHLTPITVVAAAGGGEFDQRGAIGLHDGIEHGQVGRAAYRRSTGRRASPSMADGATREAARRVLDRRWATVSRSRIRAANRRRRAPRRVLAVEIVHAIDRGPLACDRQRRQRASTARADHRRCAFPPSGTPRRPERPRRQPQGHRRSPAPSDHRCARKRVIAPTRCACGASSARARTRRTL